jgi:hypothetical protein
MTSRSVPGRHKAQQEEEDAAALKLGPGMSETAFTSLMRGLTGIVLQNLTTLAVS